MDKKKVLEQMKEHKKEILIGTGLAIGACVLAGLGIRNRSVKLDEHDEMRDKILNAFKGFEDIDIDLGIGEHQALSRKKSNNWFGAEITGLLPKDLGELGEKLMTIPDVTADTKLSVILSTDNLAG